LPRPLKATTAATTTTTTTTTTATSAYNIVLLLDDEGDGEGVIDTGAVTFNWTTFEIVEGAETKLAAIFVTPGDEGL